MFRQSEATTVQEEIAGKLRLLEVRGSELESINSERREAERALQGRKRSLSRAEAIRHYSQHVAVVITFLPLCICRWIRTTVPADKTKQNSALGKRRIVYATLKLTARTECGAKYEKSDSFEWYVKRSVGTRCLIPWFRGETECRICADSCNLNSRIAFVVYREETEGRDKQLRDKKSRLLQAESLLVEVCLIHCREPPIFNALSSACVFSFCLCLMNVYWDSSECFRHSNLYHLVFDAFSLFEQLKTKRQQVKTSSSDEQNKLSRNWRSSLSVS